VQKTGALAMTQMTPEKIKEFFDDAAKSYTDAWTAEAEYYNALVKRNGEAFTKLTDARISSFKEMTEAKTFNQAFEANLGFEEQVREDLASLQEENTKAWESLVKTLQGIYTPATEAPKAKATPKKKAA